MKRAPRFFMSHTTRDKPLVLAIDRILKSQGMAVWTDRWEIAAGDSLTQKIFDEGLQRTDYVCAFLSKFSAQSRWVKKELAVALVRSIGTGKPKIIVLRFDQTPIPASLSDLNYVDLSRHEVSEIVATILTSAKMKLMTDHEVRKPYAANDFHDALQAGLILYLLGSRPDDIDFNPITDGEGIVFKRRHLFILKIDQQAKTIRVHPLTRARPAHTVMGIIGGKLNVFINMKVTSDSFSMRGSLYKLDPDTLQSQSVSNVFDDRNWGWDPVLEEDGGVLHKSFDEEDNPVHRDDVLIKEMTWQELGEMGKKYRSEHCPLETSYGPGRETGYLRFLNVDPHLFDKLNDLGVTV